MQDVKHRHQILLSSEVFRLTIGNDVLVAQFVSLCLVRVTFQEISKEMDVKTVNVIVKKQINNNFSYSPLLMDHGNGVKIFKTLQGNHSPAACC